jgi:hypothetical protein
MTSSSAVQKAIEKIALFIIKNYLSWYGPARVENDILLMSQRKTERDLSTFSMKGEP